LVYGYIHSSYILGELSTYCIELTSGIAWTLKVILTEDQSAGSGLFRVVYPDTGESGDSYDIDVQTGPITRTWPQFKAPPSSASVMLLDTAESGDAYDAEVEQSSRGEVDDGSALQTMHRA